MIRLTDLHGAARQAVVKQLQQRPRRYGREPLVVRFALKTVSEANCHQHWRGRQRRAKFQGEFVAHQLQFAVLPELPVVVKLTRFGPRLLDSDNAPVSLKFVRDAIARMYGVDDASPLYEWRYEQQKAKEYQVRIEIHTKEKP